MLKPLPFPASRWQRALLWLASRPWAPLPAARPRQDWPPSPIFAKHRFRRVGRLWVRGPVPDTPVARAIVREGKDGAFAGVYLESAPGEAAALLLFVARDRALLPPLAQPGRWLQNFPDRHPGHALCAREAGWLFAFYLEPDGRGVFFSRRTSLDPKRNHPPQIRELRHCRPPVSRRSRRRS